MTPFIVSAGYVKPERCNTFRKVVSYVGTLGGNGHPLEPPTSLSCAGVCAAVARNFPTLRRVDGKYAGVSEHSWLAFRNDPEVVIDVYPWSAASGPALLYVGNWPINPVSRLYVERGAKCPHCHGEGGWMDEGEPTTCDRCGGKGKLS